MPSIAVCWLEVVSSRVLTLPSRVVMEFPWVVMELALASMAVCWSEAVSPRVPTLVYRVEMLLPWLVVSVLRSPTSVTRVPVVV